MILGLQPNHFRFCWHQSQQHWDDHPYYLQKAMIDNGCESIATVENELLNALETDTFHHFEMYLVAGPYVQSGFYRWAFTETFEQLASRKDWQVLAGPFAASFKGYEAAHTSTTYFRDLRLHTGPGPVLDNEDRTIRTDVAYELTDSSHWLSLVCVMRGFPDLNDYRPLMVIEFAPAQSFPEGQKIYLTEVTLSLHNQYYHAERIRHTPYRGRNLYEIVD